MVALVQTWTFAGKENVSRFYLTYNITYLMAIPKAVLLKDTEYRKNTLQNAELLIKEKKKLATSVPQASSIYGNQNLVISSKYNQ